MGLNLSHGVLSWVFIVLHSFAGFAHFVMSNHGKEVKCDHDGRLLWPQCHSSASTKCCYAFSMVRFRLEKGH